MKFVSVAIVAAFLCVVAVSAEPSTPFEELAFNPFEKIGEKIKEYLNKLKCAREVIANEVADSDLQDEFEQFKTTFDQLFKDMKNCTSSESKSEFFKCNVVVAKRMGQEFSAFLHEVSATNKEMAKEIREKVATQCVKTPEFMELESFEELAFRPFEKIVQKVKEYLAKLQCARGVIAEEADGSELKEEYEQFKTTFDQLFTELKGCSSNEGKIEFLKCNVAVIKRMGQEFSTFVRKVSDTNQEMAKRIREKIATQCVKTPEFFELESDVELAFAPFEKIVQKVKEYLKKLQCARDVIAEVVDGSELKEEYEQFKTTFDQLFKEMKGCSSNESKTEFLKCNVAVIKRMGQEFSTFVRKVSDTNQEMAKEIREKVATQCVKTPEFMELELFEELAFRPLEKIVQKVKEYLAKLQCARGVIAEEADGSELKEEYEQFKTTFDQLFKEMKGCSSNEGKTEFLKCNVAVIKRMGQEFSTFVRKVSETNQEMAKRIREKIATQCVKTPEFFQLEKENFVELLVEDEEGNTPAKQNKFVAFLKKLKCMTVALDEATKGTKHAPILDQHKKDMWEAKDNIKACRMIPSKLKSSLCTANELKKASFSLFKFFLKLEKFFKDLQADEEVFYRAKELIAKCSP